MREKMINIITMIFNISLMLFLFLGAAIVLVQLVSVFLLDGALASGINGMLKLWSIRASVVAAFCGFIVPYLSSGKK